jgi:hypothetical protein
MSIIPELLREILSEIRELRSGIEDQTSCLEMLKSVAWEEAQQSTRQKIREQQSHEHRESSKHLRRALPCQKPLLDWLETRGLRFLHFTSFPLLRGPADELAIGLSQHYRTLEPLIRSLTSSFMMKQGLHFSLAEFEDEQAETITTFAQKLEDFGMLQSLNHVLEENALFTQPTEDGEVNRFLAGGWLELRVEHLVSQMHSAWQPFRCLRNVNLRHDSEGAYELDMLLPSNGDPVHIECKSGDMNAAIPKIRRTAKVLGLPAERNFVIVPCLTIEEAVSLGRKCPATFTCLEHLSSRLAPWLPSN